MLRITLGLACVAAAAMFVFERSRPLERGLAVHNGARDSSHASSMDASGAHVDADGPIEVAQHPVWLTLGSIPPAESPAEVALGKVARAGDGLLTVTGELLHLAWDESALDGTTEYSEESLVPSGRGRVRFVPWGPPRDRVLIERSWPANETVTFESLPRGDWVVDVFEPGFAPGRASFGEDWPRFVCGLESGPTIEVDVRLPDGTQPSHAFMTYVSRGYVVQWLYEERGAARHMLRELQSWARFDDHEFYHWLPSDLRTGVVADSQGVPNDLLVVAVPREDDPYFYNGSATCRYASSVVRVDADLAGPLRVVLEEVAHATIELEVPESLAVDRKPWVRGVRRIELAGVDLADLLAQGAEFERGHYEHPDFDDFGRSGIFVEPKLTVEASYLAPGPWRFVAGWGDEPAIVVQDVELAVGWNRVVLTLGQPATEPRPRGQRGSTARGR